MDLKTIEDNPDLLSPWSDAAFHDFLDQAYIDCQVTITHMKGEVEELRAKIRQAKNMKASLQASDSRRVAPMASTGSHPVTNYHISSCSSTSVTVVRCTNYSLVNTKNTSG